MHRKIVFRLAVVVLVLTGLAASASPGPLQDSGGSIDAAFNVGTGFNAEVYAVALAMDGSGDVYVGGAFTSYNGTASNGIVRLNSNGSIDPAFNVGTGFINYVLTLASALDGSGDVYVGGYFTSYNGTASNHILRLNSNGTIDTGFNVGTGFNLYGYTRALAVDGSGDLYVGGSFNSYNGTASSKIIRLNPNGTIDAAFNVGTGFDVSYNVRALAVASDGSGDIYAGGSFPSYNGIPGINRIVRLNSNGTIDAAFNVGTGVTVPLNGVPGSSCDVYAVALASDGSGDVYLGGNFSAFNGTPSRGIVRLNADGTIDAAFNYGTGFDQDPFAFAVATDGSGDVYVGGNFTSYNGTGGINRILRLNSNGTVDTAFNVGTGFNSYVLATTLASDGSGDLYVGGSFTTYKGTASNAIARLNTGNSPPPPPPPPTPAPTPSPSTKSNSASGSSPAEEQKDILPCSAGTSAAPLGILALAVLISFAAARRGFQRQA